MKAPDFWWRPQPSAASRLLWPAAKLYGAAAGRRMERPPAAHAAAQVVCVGNFVVGGAGKTPTALALVEIAKSRGLRPGLLTRGYGGREAGPLLVDPAHHGPAAVGDEPLLLAAAAPTVVARDRPAGAALLVGYGVDLIIMDDGFQNPSLHKDLSLLVVDGAAGLGNGSMIPAGPVRAPVRDQLLRAAALVIVGGGEGAEPLVRAASQAGRSVLRARFVPAGGLEIGDVPVLAFAGIGRPEKFFATLRENGVAVGGAVAFPDHHVYSPADARYLIRRAEEEGLRLVTTDKDHVRLGSAEGAVAELRQRSLRFSVRLAFDVPEIPARLIAAMLERKAAERLAAKRPAQRRS